MQYFKNSSSLSWPNKLLSRFIKADAGNGLMKDSFFAFIFKIFGIGASYLFTFIVSKQYGAEGWGLFSLTITCGGFYILIGKLGFDTALLRLTAEYHAREDFGTIRKIYLNTVKLIFPLCIILTIIFFTCAEFTADHIFHKSYLATYLKFGAFMILPSVFFLINSEGLRGLKKIKKYVFIQNLGYFLIASILMLVFYSYRNVFLPISSYLISLYIIFFLSLYWWLKELKKTSKVISQNVLKLKKILSISIPMFWSNAMFIIINWSDTIILGIYSSEYEVGIYNIAMKVASIITIPLLAINSISAPKFAGFYATKDSTGLKNLVSLSSRIIFYTSLIVFIFLLLFPEVFLKIFGKEFTEGSEVLTLLSIGYFINALAGPNDVLLQMTGHEKIFQNIIISAMILNIALNFILIPYYGIKGAAISSMTTMMFWNILAVVFIKAKLGVSTVHIPLLKYIKN